MSNEEMLSKFYSDFDKHNEEKSKLLIDFESNLEEINTIGKLQLTEPRKKIKVKNDSIVIERKTRGRRCKSLEF